MSKSAWIFVVALLLLAAGLSAQDDRYILTASDGMGQLGDLADITVSLDVVPGTLGAPVSLAAWSYGVCHDPTRLVVSSVADGATTQTINAPGGPYFYQVNIDPDPGDGFYVALVIDFNGTNQLDPGVGYELNVASYLVVATAPLGITPIEFCGTLHPSPPQPTVEVFVVEIGGATATPPVTISGSIQIVDNGTGTGQDTTFIRGNCNGDYSVNIADSIHFLGYLFPGANPPNQLNCLDACDGNDDGQIDIADAVTVIGTLFGSPTIPLPHPNMSDGCGLDPTPDDLGCVSYPNCP